MLFQINKREVALNITGQPVPGDDSVLVNLDDNLISRTSWKDSGFTVVPFLEKAEFKLLKSGLFHFFRQAIQKAGFGVAADFNIAHYHKLPGLTREKHLEVLETTKRIFYKNFPIDPEIVVRRIAGLVNIPLTLKNPQTKDEIFHLRIVRPGSSDFNPLHRDAWIPDLKHSLNLYVGIAGSTDLSALGLVPGSHLWPESKVERTLEGAEMNGTKYHVPGLIQASEEINLVRPNPGDNEVLVFSPYLIHGGSANFNPDETRVSLELRLWRK